MAIESTATILDAIGQITGSPPPLVHTELVADSTKKGHALRAVVLSIVPSDNLNLLSGSADPSLKDLLDAVLTHLESALPPTTST